MKIAKQTIVDFLTKMRMQSIDKCLLNFNEDGVHVQTMPNDMVVGAVGFLPETSFVEYQAVGAVGVDELGSLINVFKKFDDEVEFNVEGNLLTAKSKAKEMRLELVDERFFEQEKDLNDALNNQFSYTFEVSAEKIQDFIKDASSNKNFEIQLNTVTDGVQLTNTGKFKFTYNIEASNIPSGIKINFRQAFVDALNNVKKGKMTMYLEKSDYLLKVKHETEQYTINFLVTPVITNK